MWNNGRFKNERNNHVEEKIMIFSYEKLIFEFFIQKFLVIHVNTLWPLGVICALQIISIVFFLLGSRIVFFSVFW